MTTSHESTQRSETTAELFLICGATLLTYIFGIVMEQLQPICSEVRARKLLRNMPEMYEVIEPTPTSKTRSKISRSCRPAGAAQSISPRVGDSVGSDRRVI